MQQDNLFNITLSSVAHSTQAYDCHTPFCMPQVLISRNYRGDVDMSAIDKFMPLVMENEEESVVTPLLCHSQCTFIYIKYNNLYLVATTRKNANVALVFSFLHKLVQVALCPVCVYVVCICLPFCCIVYLYVHYGGVPVL